MRITFDRARGAAARRRAREAMLGQLARVEASQDGVRLRVAGVHSQTKTLTFAKALLDRGLIAGLSPHRV